MINLESRRVLLVGCLLFIVLVLILGSVQISLLLRDNERQDTLEAVGTEVKALAQTLWAVQNSVATFDELFAAITNANLTPEHDTIILTANIALERALPPISTPITLEGAGHSVDGVGSYQVFFVTVSGNFTVNAITIQNGTAQDGGGIHNDGTLTVMNSTFSDNSAENYGGGIYAPFDSTVTVMDSTFSGNKAGLGGGGISTNSTLNVTGSTFSGNSSTNSGSEGGGAIHNNQGVVTIMSSTLSGNSAGSTGGGISNRYNATLTVTGSTFSGNSSTNRFGEGGGIYNDGDSSISLAGNLFQQGATGSNCSGTVEDLGYNLSSDMSCHFSSTGSENSVTAILLGPLTNNGGPTQTHALQPNSAALNRIPKDYIVVVKSGEITLCKSGSTDQRGEPRPNPPDGMCDIGAYEAGP